MATRLGNSQRKRATSVATSLPEMDWDQGPAPRKVLTPDQLRDEVRRRWLGAAVQKDMSRNLIEQGRCMREAQEEVARLRQEIEEARVEAERWLERHHRAQINQGRESLTQNACQQGRTETWVLHVLDQLAKDRNMLRQESWRYAQKCQDLQEENERQRSSSTRWKEG